MTPTSLAGPILIAVLAGLLVGVSRQVNGRLSLSTSPLVASLWNHVVGFVLLTALGLAVGGLLPTGAADAPWHAFVGGPIGVVFVAAGSWLLTRIGALNSALLVIGGQMASGVTLDFALGAPAAFWPSAAGVGLILCGVALTQRRKARRSPEGVRPPRGSVRTSRRGRAGAPVPGRRR